jgi:hypothetical protein
VTIGTFESNQIKWEVERFIRQRAERIGKLAADVLVDGEANHQAIEAFKYAFLVLRAPHRFMERFRGCGLEIDSEAVELFITDNEGTLFYGANSYLLTEEERLISSHNLHVSLLGGC